MRSALVVSVAALAGAVALSIAACGGGAEPGRVAAPATVFAAASLTEILPAIDPEARFSFAGSDELATQIREGAPADVYAAATARYPRELHDEGLVGEPVTFATNRLVLVVPAGNPAGIGTVEDLASAGVKLVVAAEGVPAGDYTRTVLAALGLEPALENVVSKEDDVKGVVGKVALGEADAGFVYATDAAVAAGAVEVIELPEGSQPAIEYQLAVVSTTANRAAAEAFVARVLSAQGRAELEAAGFEVP